MWQRFVLAWFLTWAVLLCLALHYYLWARLVRDPGWPPLATAAGGWFFAAVAWLVPVGLALRPEMRTGIAGNYVTVSAPQETDGSGLLERAAQRLAVVVWLAYGWMGVLFLLFLWAVAGEAVRAALPVSARAWAVVGLTALPLLLAWGGWAAARPARVTPLELKLARWPEALRGFTIVHVSDVHVGPTYGAARVEELVAQVNALDADLVAITGDLVDGTVRELAAAVAPLARLKARCGVFFVTGNHDYYSGVTPWLAHLASLGVRALRNERVEVQLHGASFDLAGIDDAQGHKYAEGHGADLGRAAAGRDPSRPFVLLAHQPKQVVQARAHGVQLMLSGHTHAGQLWPFGYAVRLIQPYVWGRHTEPQGLEVYVSAGAGHWGPPLRLGAPAEIARIVISPP